jgi:pyruvate/2-oxoacid:ferredoxin oxidoreductase beta subunit
MSEFVISAEFPYCKGCGHHLVARNTVRALEQTKLRPLDVILVTDIGCHGIVDRCFATHSVHGLHGRSTAIAAGIAMAVPRDKKVIVFIGDGGATIGLQHILEAARLNLPLTVVVHNNMLYGMTGGQPSGLTPCGFRTSITPQGHPFPHHDLCRLALDAGAAFTARVIGIGDFSAILHQAIECPGFSLVEVLELCTSYGVKMNPHLNLRHLADQQGYALGNWLGQERPALRLTQKEPQRSLLDEPEITPRYSAALERQTALLLSGSAGEGVQSAAELFSLAAIASRLHVAKKGSYPVTVQVGFSSAEILISPQPILCHAFDHPDLAIIVSQDGLTHELERLRQMQVGIVWLDSSLAIPETPAEVRRLDFRQRAGARNAALYALLSVVNQTGVLPLPALIEAIQGSPLGKRIPADLLRDFNFSWLSH